MLASTELKLEVFELAGIGDGRGALGLDWFVLDTTAGVLLIGDVETKTVMFWEVELRYMTEEP